MQRAKTPTGIQPRKARLPVEGLFCSYSHRSCMHNRLDGYDYCQKHILEDKTAPFKHCGYISSINSKRCNNPAPKSDRKEGYCPEHARKSMLQRQKNHRKRKSKETAESLLEDLDHFKLVSGSDGILEHQRQKSSTDNLASKTLEYASSDDSDAELPLVDQAWRGDADSDAESIDSDQEDLLKHAGVYTAEEVALIMRDKLIRLQSLYIDQFKRLQYIMKEKRRKYLQTHKQEKDALGSIKFYKNQVSTREKYGKLKALTRYHKRHGKEALLHRQSKQRRIAVSEGPNYRPPSFPRCIHVDVTLQKCSERALPLSKYCAQHINNDSYQVLFRPCHFGNGVCGKPVFSLEEDAHCPRHAQLKPEQTRVSLKEEGSGDLSDVKSELTKEALELLLPQLDFSAQEILSRQLLTQNPEMPDTIFSVSDTDVGELIPDSSSLTHDLEKPTTSSNLSIRSEIQSSSKNIHNDSLTEQKPKFGPLLLQHLQGDFDTTNYRDTYNTSNTTPTSVTHSSSIIGQSSTVTSTASSASENQHVGNNVGSSSSHDLSSSSSHDHTNNSDHVSNGC